MNIIIQKYGPPIAVIAIAVYLGWPPETPMDLGDDLVRAKSVRWKVSDLESPMSPSVSGGNPFAKVLVKHNLEGTSDSDDLAEAATPIIAGPTELDIENGLKLGGIAKTDHQEWAIVNRDVCRIGDQVPVIGLVDVVATIRDIEDDQITVVVGKLVVKIRTQERNRPSAKPAAVSTLAADRADRAVEQTADEQSADEQSADEQSADEQEVEDVAKSEGQDDVRSETTADKKRKINKPAGESLLDAIQRGLGGNSRGTQ